MKLYMLLIVSALTLALSAHAEQEQSTESLYKDWIAAASSQNHSEALTRGMQLFHALQKLPRWDSCNGEPPFEVNFLFDIGNTLIHLSRWEEARYCLTSFLIHVLNDEELAQTFVPDFSKTEWLRTNRIENQPFFLETLPNGEQNALPVGARQLIDSE